MAAEVSGKVRQGLTLCFVGDDAGIVPQTLRRRQALRRAKSPALQSTRKRAVMRKRQLSARSAGGRERPPYIAVGNGRWRGSGSQSLGLAAGRCKHRPLRRGGGGVRQTGRGLAEQGAAPLRRLRRHYRFAVPASCGAR